MNIYLLSVQENREHYFQKQTEAYGIPVDPKTQSLLLPLFKTEGKVVYPLFIRFLKYSYVK